MERFTAGQIVVLPFPFSDLTQNKFRPALLLADAGRGDWIACQITSNAYADVRAVVISEGDFINGGLLRQSYARAGKLFTANEILFRRVAGTLQADMLIKTRKAVIQLLQSELI
ncbi:type II toxin-antitoxin system PemK/MazF family toxin [Chromatium okenii]|jgi:mRNA interferase MazF|uniref:MazF family transcriptional regulator n=1 Tax=Chromatium okenii TaxID=61644 RepID=A0A2S7XVB7_9GAMM|nr:type II toxin-antitoxin system PemK/MazF family toxin [Chromatium okenii]MBV5309484.1 type II toxin-antitoxin system PemK/MazF family toxin [Chromatium okenii]PQJ97630.1 MazF family transcriptional regulator [Chromatium okenii]